tara:strand:+ start:1372 stop:2781 length:1410 start_codon:yes stop_codon:yes gene_type:complete
LDPFTIISAGLTIFSAIMGASSQSAAAAHNKKQVKDQRKYAKKLAKLKTQELIDSTEYAKDSYDIAVANYNLEREYQEKLMTDQWIQSVNLQNKAYNDSVDAFNASVEAHDEQVDFNKISADVAIRDSQRVRQETYDDLAFQAEDIRIELESGREDRRLQLKDLDKEKRQSKRRYKLEKKGIKRDLEAARDQFNTSMSELTALTDSARAETAEKLRVQRYESLLEEGKFRSKGMAGRSALKAQRSMAAQDAFAQQAIVDALMRNDRMSNIEKQKLVDNINQQRKSAKYSIQILNAKIREDVENRNAQRLGIGLKEVQAGRMAGFNLEKLEKSRLSADGQYQAELTQIRLDRYAANIAAQNNLLNEPDKPKPLPRPYMPPEPIIQEPLEPDFEAVKKLNKKAGQAIPEPYAPSAVYTWGQAAGKIAQATATLRQRTPQNPLTPAPSPAPSPAPTNYQIPQAATPISTPSF